MATTSVRLSLAVLVALCSSGVPVLGQNTTTGQQFVGPGYIACPVEDYDVQQCEYDIDPDCSISTLLSCNFTTEILPSFDDALTTLYLPLVCGCATASNCPSTCTFNEGVPPARAPVESTANFTGVGSVTCIAADFVTAPCAPSIDNFTACGTCDTSAFTQNASGFQVGDEFITFPLPCECISMRNCPSTCTFTPGLNGTDSTPTSVTTPIVSPAPTPEVTPAVTPTTNSASDVPTGITTAPSLAPLDNVPSPTTTTNGTTAAPRRAPTSNLTVPTPTSNSTTSSAYSNNGPLGKMIVIMLSLMVFSL